jgi:hypothetical protein
VLEQPDSPLWVIEGEIRGSASRSGVHRFIIYGGRGSMNATGIGAKQGVFITYTENEKKLNFRLL